MTRASPVLVKPSPAAPSWGNSRAGSRGTPVRSRTVRVYSTLLRRRITTRPGKGTTFHLQLPITLSVLRAVLVRVAGDPYALPLNRTDRLLRLPADRVRTLEGKPHFEVDGRHVGLVPAHQVLEPRVGHEITPGQVRDEHQLWRVLEDGGELLLVGRQ